MKDSTSIIEDRETAQSSPEPERVEFDTFTRPRKRVFIFLLLVTSLLLVGVAFLLWWVPYVGLANIHEYVPVILAVLLGCIVLVSLGAVLTLVFTIIRGKNLFFNRRIRGVVIRVLFPLLVGVGKCFGIKKSEIRRSFVAINNQLVMAEAQKVAPEKMLILLPPLPAEP